MKKIKPLKRFGQNYLTDQNILNKIVNEIDPNPGETIIEIGPGQGALTKKLLNKVDNLIAVEIDKRVISYLINNFKQLTLIEDDFLNVDLNKLKQKEKLRIVGNIPYNITSPILFKLIENNILIKDAVFMVQLEVAKRMVAQRGTKDYGILAVLLKYFTHAKICFKISPNVFYPKPKVYSALVYILFKELNDSNDFQHKFIEVVKAAFGNRRKTLKNSFGNSIFRNNNFSTSGIDMSLRAEQLEVSDFIKLTKATLNESG